MSDTPDLKPVTAADLQKLLDNAKHSPTEMARLQSDPEGVLADMGLIATPGAVEFLRTMGAVPFTDTPASPSSKDPSEGMGEL